jgi:hypothetical protein
MDMHRILEPLNNFERQTMGKSGSFTLAIKKISKLVCK